MKKTALVFAASIISVTSLAQGGKPWIHDPSTIMECDGKYYTFGTGGGGLISEDGWTWHDGAVRPGGGAAPDAIKIGERYLVVYGATGGGLGGGHSGSIFTMWNKTLDPESPDFEYSEAMEVASSKIDEDCDAIDPSLLLDPGTGRLWLSYGTYFGFIRLVELNPDTGTRVEGNKPLDIAIDCEATALLYRDGWYYLFGTHGTCCDGVNSTYNIVCGRSRQVTGPYLDNMGRDMIKGGGRMVLAAGRRYAGPGHFGHIFVEEGVEKMSCHYEADFERSGRSVLAIHPLLWKDGWPCASDNFEEGMYSIISERRGYALELAVDFTRLESGVRRMFRGWRDDNEPLVSLENQKLEDVAGSWPEGDVAVRTGDFMNRPHQNWQISVVPEARGYLGGQYCKIVIDGTDRALTATADREVIASTYSGDANQLWRIDRLTDGSYRILPKEIPGCDEQLVLVSVADSTPSLGKFDFGSDNSKWNFKK